MSICTCLHVYSSIFLVSKRRRSESPALSKLLQSPDLSHHSSSSSLCNTGDEEAEEEEHMEEDEVKEEEEVKEEDNNLENVDVDLNSCSEKSDDDIDVEN